MGPYVISFCKKMSVSRDLEGVSELRELSDLCNLGRMSKCMNYYQLIFICQGIVYESYISKTRNTTRKIKYIFLKNCGEVKCQSVFHKSNRNYVIY